MRRVLLRSLTVSLLVLFRSGRFSGEAGTAVSSLRVENAKLDMSALRETSRVVTKGK